ncbi:MAG: hypothetical protein IPF61_13255 [Xanthomonadales bacterium]|nr:hypothetical protein [Xanthomonadales bacterium]
MRILLRIEGNRFGSLATVRLHADGTRGRESIFRSVSTFETGAVEYRLAVFAAFSLRWINPGA